METVLEGHLHKVDYETRTTELLHYYYRITFRTKSLNVICLECFICANSTVIPIP